MRFTISDGGFYRGGATLVPRRGEVRFDRLTGMLRPIRGVSVYNDPGHPNLGLHGGAYRLGPILEGLRVIQVGRDPAHHEIVPAVAMSFDDYAALLSQIPLAAIATTS